MDGQSIAITIMAITIMLLLVRLFSKHVRFIPTIVFPMLFNNKDSEHKEMPSLEHAKATSLSLKVMLTLQLLLDNCSEKC